MLKSRLLKVHFCQIVQYKYLMDFVNRNVLTDFQSIWIVKNGISDMSIRLDMISHTIFQEKIQILGISSK